MNTSKLEQLLLLEQSGELTAKQRRELEAELAASAEARALRDELRGLAAALPNPAAARAPDAAERIAARLEPSRTPAPVFRPAWKPALAAAAALALLIGIQAFRGPRPSAAVQTAAVQTTDIETATVVEDEWTDPLDAEFTEIESLLLAVSEDPYGFEDL